MRRLTAALIYIFLLSASTSPEHATLPTVAADTLTITAVQRASELLATGFMLAPDTLVVARPAAATEGAKSSVFVVDANGELLRRVAIEYGVASPSLIQVAGGPKAGDRIVVSDMRDWDAFERIQLKLR